MPLLKEEKDDNIRDNRNETTKEERTTYNGKREEELKAAKELSEEQGRESQVVTERVEAINRKVERFETEEKPLRGLDGKTIDLLQEQIEK